MSLLDNTFKFNRLLYQCLKAIAGKVCPLVQRSLLLPPTDTSWMA